MNRRDFLKVLGALGLATQIPDAAAKMIEEAPAAPITPALTSLFDGQTFRIAFPDGQEWTFRGVIEALATKSPIDGLMSADVIVRPIGPMTVNNAGVTQIKPETVGATYDVPVGGTAITRNGKLMGELTEVTLPTLTRNCHQLDSENYMAGLRRQGALAFSVMFDNAEEAQGLLEDPLGGTKP